MTARFLRRVKRSRFLTSAGEAGGAAPGLTMNVSADSPRGPAEEGRSPMGKPYRVVPDSLAEFYAKRVRKLSDAELLAAGPYGCRGCGEYAAFGCLDGSGEMLCEG